MFYSYKGKLIRTKESSDKGTLYNIKDVKAIIGYFYVPVKEKAGEYITKAGVHHVLKTKQCTDFTLWFLSLDSTKMERLSLLKGKPIAEIVKEEYLAAKDLAYEMGTPPEQIPDLAMKLVQTITGVPLC